MPGLISNWGLPTENNGGNSLPQISAPDKPTLSSSSSAFSGQNLVQVTRIVCHFSGNLFLLRLSIAEFAFRHHFLLQLHLPLMEKFSIGVNSHVLLLIRSSPCPIQMITKNRECTLVFIAMDSARFDRNYIYFLNI